MLVFLNEKGARVVHGVILLLCVFAYVYGRSADGNTKELFQLSLIHINDFHARFEQTSPSSGTCQTSEDDSCVGGIARIATVVKSLVNDRPNPILLNAGDNFQGTLWYTKYKWNVTAHFMNMLPHDVLTLGNHEFDDNIEGVVPFLENVKAPFVVANIDDTEEPSMHGKYNKSIVIERGGKKIGIIGYVLKTFNEISKTGKLKFLDEIETVTAEAAKLKNENVDIIIGLSHSGLDVDKEVAAAVPDLDIIVGGHSHSFLYTGIPPAEEKPVDNYPVIVEQPGGRKVLIVQAYAYSKYVGNITIWFDEKGEYVAWDGRPILLDKSVPQDPQTVEAMKPWKELIDAEGSRVIGTTSVYLNAFDGACQKGECNIGNLIADSFVNEYVKYAEPGSWTRAAIGIVNSGGIRASIEETGPGGNITYNDLLTAQPFANTIDVIELQGKYLLEALEFSASRSYSTARGNGHHKRAIESKEFSGQGFLQMSGIRITFNISDPIESRVKNVSVRCADCLVPQYESLDMEKWYRIAIISYLVNGGDGYYVITNNARNHVIGRVDYEVIIDYISKISPVTTGIEDHIRVLQ